MEKDGKILIFVLSFYIPYCNSDIQSGLYIRSMIGLWAFGLCTPPHCIWNETLKIWVKGRLLALIYGVWQKCGINHLEITAILIHPLPFLVAYKQQTNVTTNTRIVFFTVGWKSFAVRISGTHIQDKCWVSSFELLCHTCTAVAFSCCLFVDLSVFSHALVSEPSVAPRSSDLTWPVKNIPLFFYLEKLLGCFCYIFCVIIHWRPISFQQLVESKQKIQPCILQISSSCFYQHSSHQ